MINEFSVKLRSTNNKAKIAFTVTLILAAAVFAVSLIVSTYKGIIGLAAMILIVAAVLIYTKYVGPEYYYDITTDSDGVGVFVVRMMNGKRATTLCRIGLAEVIKLEREGRKERSEHKTPVGVKVYSYSPTLMPELTYRLHTRSRYEKAEIIIEINDELAAVLKEYIAEARMLEKELED